MIFGWIASIYWGYLFYKQANDTELDPIINPGNGGISDLPPRDPRYNVSGLPNNAGNFPGAPGYGAQNP